MQNYLFIVNIFDVWYLNGKSYNYLFGAQRSGRGRNYQQDTLNVLTCERTPRVMVNKEKHG